MPICENTLYPAPFFLPGGHAQTIYPAFFRTLELPECTVERIVTHDNDFVEVDMHYAVRPAVSRRLVIISHGLEGDSKRPYMKGMVRAVTEAGWDAAAWNFRGCSGVLNKKLQMYHSGSVEDLNTLITHYVQKGYEEIVLVGFSIGGNQILKYLGDPDNVVNSAVQASVVFSVPCDLAGTAKALDKSSNVIYMKNFMRTLKEKILKKHKQFPNLVDISRINEIKTFREFDETYTARWYGFKDAEDYWRRNSSLQFIENIRIPTLLVSARNDPFLCPTCYPTGMAHRSKYFYLEAPVEGGHIGFVRMTDDNYYWSEIRTVEFLQQELGR